MSRREARARQHEPGAAFGNRDRDARADACPLPRREPGGLGREEVVAGVVLMRAPRCLGARPEDFELDDHSSASPPSAFARPFSS